MEDEKKEAVHRQMIFFENVGEIKAKYQKGECQHG